MRTPRDESEYLMQFFKAYAFFDVRLDIINYKRTVTYNAFLMAKYMVKTIINELEVSGYELNYERLEFYNNVLQELNIYNN
jgi:hypothetical protein